MQEESMKLFCKLPFSRISIDDDGNIWPACCPDWVQFPLGNIFKQKWEDIWYGEAAKKFRDSMFDGSLQYCKWGWCPNIADAQAGIENYHVIPLKKSPRHWTEAPPVHVNMNYDMTCNLKCPSCRADYIHYTGDKLAKVQYLQEYVEKQILPELESIALTGVGDPFMSRVLRNFLINFDSKKYPRSSPKIFGSKIIKPGKAVLMKGMGNFRFVIYNFRLSKTKGRFLTIYHRIH